MHVLLFHVVESKELLLSYTIAMNIVHTMLSKPQLYGVFFSCLLSERVYLP